MRYLILAIALLIGVGCQQEAPAATRTPTVVVYSATWCGPCQEQKDSVKRLERRHDITVKHVDCSNGFPEGIVEVPTYRVYDANGNFKQEVHSITGLIKVLKILKIIFLG